MSSHRPPQPPIVILGGGLAGLSTALHLSQSGDPPAWRLFEKDARVGGHTKTDQREGFHFDRTGHWLHLRHDDMRALVGDLLPGELVSVDRRARVLSHDVLTRYPFQANLHGLPPSVIKECLLGYIERPSELVATTFQDYCLKHFGAGISRHFMVPYNQKLWGVPPTEITASWCERFVPRPSLEQVVAGAVGAAPPELGYNVSFLYPRRGGIEALPRAVAARLDHSRIATSAPLERFSPKEKWVQIAGERIAYGSLVATIPLPELMAAAEGLPPDVAQAALRLRATSLQYLNVATKRSPAVDFHWLYVPEARYPFYRVGIYTNAVPANAPAGCGALYVELGRRDVKTVDEVLPDVIAGLVTAKILSGPEDLLFAELRTLQYAYVVFDEHHASATKTIFEYLAHNDIYPCGRYGEWTYSSMEDALWGGKQVAVTLSRPKTT